MLKRFWKHSSKFIKYSSIVISILGGLLGFLYGIKYIMRRQH